MKVTVERNTLLAALGRAKAVVERRNSIPILGNILIRAGKDLRFQSTDMDMAINETIPANIEAQGAATVAAHGLHDIVKEMPKGSEVEIETATTANGEEKLLVRSGRTLFTLPCLPVDDYPKLATVDMSCRFTLEAAELCSLIKPVRHAISTEETRYYLNGIFLHVTTPREFDGMNIKALRAVATDGHRLAQADVQLPAGAADMPDSIIPTKAVGIIYGLAGKHDGKIKVKTSETRISFTFGPVTFLSKLVDGTYPDVQRVIPTENGLHMTADRKQLAAVVKRVSRANGFWPSVKWTLEPNSLTISTSSPEGGEANEEVEVVYQGRPFEIGFNARYLTDTLGAMAGPEAEFAMADAAGPAVIRDPANASVLHVLMPLRV